MCKMSSPIEILWRQALKTFTGRGDVGYKLCRKNFDKLHALMNNIKADDVKVDAEVLNYVENNPAPMCVMDVYENQDITIAVFLLKHGATLPLHDHPEMNGLLKVIHGTVNIENYSTLTRIEGKKINDEILAFKHATITMQKNDNACILTPHHRNLHEIRCIKGPAAFLDILSPPYRVDDDENEIADRPCTFFKEISEEEESKSSDDDPSSTLVKLMIVQLPTNFYSMNIKYSGEALR